MDEVITEARKDEFPDEVILEVLRDWLWDNVLLQTDSGTSFMNNFNQIYYSFSPIIADYERENPAFQETVKVAITPMISSLSILNPVEMSSDQEVLGHTELVWFNSMSECMLESLWL